VALQRLAGGPDERPPTCVVGNAWSPQSTSLAIRVSSLAYGSDRHRWHSLGLVHAADVYEAHVRAKHAGSTTGVPSPPDKALAIRRWGFGVRSGHGSYNHMLGDRTTLMTGGGTVVLYGRASHG